MKLRSGKVLDYDKLPRILEDELNNILGSYKALLSNNIEFGKTLLGIISNADRLSDRFNITDKINGFFNGKDNNIEQNLQSALESLSGSLLMLIVGVHSFYEENHLKPRYHDMIQEKLLKTYDTDTSISLSGEINQVEDVEL